MRTTIDLPDTLFRRVKLTALQRHQTLKQLLTEVIDSALPAEDQAIRRLAAPPINLHLAKPLPAFSNREAAGIMGEAESGDSQ